MSGLQLAIAHGVKLAVLAALVGAFARGHYRRCWSFTVYLGVIVTCNTMVTTWPSIFYTQTFWLAKQAAYDALKFAIAIELGYRAVRAFPGAARGARFAALLGLALSLSVILTGAARMPYEAQFDWQPQIVAASIWLFALVALLVAWYQLPLDDWSRAIVMGFAPYLLVFVTLLNVLKHNGWGAWRAASIVDSLCYLAVVSWWAWSAWQPATSRTLTEDDVRGAIAGGAMPRRA